MTQTMEKIDRLIREKNKEELKKLKKNINICHSDRVKITKITGDDFSLDDESVVIFEDSEKPAKIKYFYYLIMTGELDLLKKYSPGKVESIINQQCDYNSLYCLLYYMGRNKTTKLDLLKWLVSKGMNNGAIPYDECGIIEMISHIDYSEHYEEFIDIMQDIGLDLHDYYYNSMLNKNINFLKIILDKTGKNTSIDFLKKILNKHSHKSNKYNQLYIEDLNNIYELFEKNTNFDDKEELELFSNNIIELINNYLKDFDACDVDCEKLEKLSRYDSKLKDFFMSKFTDEEHFLCLNLLIMNFCPVNSPVHDLIAEKYDEVVFGKDKIPSLEEREILCRSLYMVTNRSFRAIDSEIFYEQIQAFERNSIKRYKKIIEEKNKEIDELSTQIRYMPGGCEYFEAKSRFEEAANTNIDV